MHKRVHTTKIEEHTTIVYQCRLSSLFWIKLIQKLKSIENDWVFLLFLWNNINWHCIINIFLHKMEWVFILKSIHREDVFFVEEEKHTEVTTLTKFMYICPKNVHIEWILEFAIILYILYTHTRTRMHKIFLDMYACMHVWLYSVHVCIFVLCCQSQVVMCFKHVIHSKTPMR